MTAKRSPASLKARLTGGGRNRPVAGGSGSGPTDDDDDDVVDLPAIIKASARPAPAGSADNAAHLPHWREKVPNLIEPELDVAEVENDWVGDDDPSILQDDITELPVGFTGARRRPEAERHPLPKPELEPEPDTEPPLPVSKVRRVRRSAARQVSEPSEQTTGRGTDPAVHGSRTRPEGQTGETAAQPEHEADDATETQEWKRPSPIVPQSTMAGRALALVVAIMGFLACLTVGALTILYDATRDWQSDIAREVTIQVEPVAGVDMAEMLSAAVALAESWPGVASATALSDRETRSLLAPWLGAGLDIDELPVPRLVTVELSDRGLFDPAAARQALEAAVTGATFDDHQRWTDRLSTMAAAAFWIGVIVFFLVLTAMVLSVTFATRAAMAANRNVIEVLHLVGAENGFIAGEFQRHFLVLGLKGGCIGGAAAIVALLAAAVLTTQSQGSAVADQVSALTGGFSLGPQAILGAVLVVALIAVITALTSRLTVHRFIHETN